MSLLDKATIITTPTAHSNGVLHSIKGGSVADFDVVRGSAATRVNAEGLIEDISILSGELITNGDFSNGSTGWTLGSGWSVSDGKAVGTSATGVLYTSIIVTASNRARIKADVSISGGGIQLRVGGVSLGYFYDNIDYVFTSNGNGLVEFIGQSFNGSIDNVSVIEITDATNIPRIDYTDGTASILLEPQSTNIAKHSEQLNTAPNVADNANYVSNFYVAPNGLTEAPKFEENTANARHGFYQYQAVTSGSYSVSIYTKQLDRRYISLQSDITGSSQFTFFDLQAGDVVSEGAGWSANIDAVGDNGWYRLSATCTAVSGTRFVIFGGSLDGLSNTYLGDGSLFTFWGLQLEALPYSTSYIPTSGAIATRLADSVSGAGDATTFNSTEGVLYAEIAALADDGTNRLLSISDGTNNIIQLYYTSTSNQIRAQVLVGGSLTVDFRHVLSDETNFNKIGFKWKVNDFALWVNGIEVGTNNSGAVFTPNTLDNLSFLTANSGALKFFGKVKSVITFDTALTDAELQCLTTI